LNTPLEGSQPKVMAPGGSRSQPRGIEARISDSALKLVLGFLVGGGGATVYYQKTDNVEARLTKVEEAVQRIEATQGTMRGNDAEIMQLIKDVSTSLAARPRR
jgi:hypothetical protein